MSRSFYLNLLIAGMALGTAWAIRGQFGHVQGATWAGAVGTLCIVLLSKRQDWYNKALQATLAGAIGWGIGGIMSYGIVVGYGRGTDFVNVYYGLSMLFVIGSLYGFIGGGLFGLVLSGSAKRPIKWNRLLPEMITGALILYYFCIEEFSWKMTPPRSEMWAACAGMAIALAWFISRKGYASAMRVAIFSAFGGGFGFAFGNFLQVMGSVSEIHFNFWNVMEYSIGFFGGIGMAYGTFTSSWEETPQPSVKRNSLLFPLLMLVLIVPLIVWQQTFETEKLNNTYSAILNGIPGSWPDNIIWIAFFLILVSGGFLLYRHFYTANSDEVKPKELKTLFAVIFGLYLLLSLLVTGAVMSTYRIEQYLYLINYAAIFLLLTKSVSEFRNHSLSYKKYALNFFWFLIFLALLVVVAISSHGELGHTQVRFP